MIHYTCDLCGRSIREERFIARIEVAAAFDPDQLTEEDLEADHLEQIADAIAQMDSTGDFDLDDQGPRTMQFDLCPSCCQRYLQAPLGPGRATRMNYSKN